MHGFLAFGVCFALLANVWYYAAIFAIFALLYLHAWRVRAQLELTPLEAIRAQVSLFDQLAMVFIGLFSTALVRTMSDRYVAHSISGRRERQLQ